MVLVMDNGSAAEWGRPATLLDNPNGTFTSKPPAPLPAPHSSVCAVSHTVKLHQKPCHCPALASFFTQPAPEPVSYRVCLLGV